MSKKKQDQEEASNDEAKLEAEKPESAESGNAMAEEIDWQDKYKRVLADNQNLLKQTAKEKEEFRRFAQIRFVEQILPVYDNLKASLAHVGEEKSPWVQGVEYVLRQFADTLKQLGVEEIETAGREFDHHEMEAVDEEEAIEAGQVGKVAKQLTAGYKLQGRLIRPARVVVYKEKIVN
jgi:molecular chaperone GrpE